MKRFSLAICLTLFFLNAIYFAQTPSSEVARKASERMAQGDLNGALAILDQAIQKKKDLFEVYKMRAQLRLMSGDINAAIDDLNRALEINPKNAELYDQRAHLRTFVRQNDLALKDYDAAISWGLKTEKVYNGRAQVKRDLGEYDAAIADYQTALAMRPLFAAAHVGLALTYNLMGKPNASLAQLETFVKQYEEYKNGKLPQVKGENVGETFAIKREGAEKDGSQSFLVGGSTRFKIKADSPEEFEMRKDQMEQRMNVAVAYLNLALAYDRRGDFDRALATIEKSLAINSNDFAALATRGKIRLDKGDAKSAVEDLNAALYQSPRNFSAYADRGIALLLLGRDADAQKDFDKYLQIMPTARESLNKRIAEAKEKRLVQPSPQQ